MILLKMLFMSGLQKDSGIDSDVFEFFDMLQKISMQKGTIIHRMKKAGFSTEEIMMQMHNEKYFKTHGIIKKYER